MTQAVTEYRGLYSGVYVNFGPSPPPGVGKEISESYLKRKKRKKREMQRKQKKEER
jgi:hypothetical protein